MATATMVKRQNGTSILWRVSPPIEMREGDKANYIETHTFVDDALNDTGKTAAFFADENGEHLDTRAIPGSVILETDHLAVLKGLGYDEIVTFQETGAVREPQPGDLSAQRAKEAAEVAVLRAMDRPGQVTSVGVADDDTLQFVVVAYRTADINDPDEQAFISALVGRAKGE